jgi:DNA invertase Pin-like site-specific DNA recombinase
MLRAALYIRVSTDEQTEYSPTAQLKALQRYADNNEMVVLPENIYIDEGISGRTAAKRPEFMKMIAAAKRKDKPFDIILVHKFDRFARSREDSVVYKSLLRNKCGVRVVSITESIEDDRISLLVEPMLEALAEYYSVNLSEEVKKGMTEKAYRGEYQTVAPFGYRWVDGALTVDEWEKRYVEYIFTSFLNGMSRHEIAIRLNVMGVRSHRGNPMENRSVGYILANPVYCGYSRWTPNGTMTDKGISDSTESIVAKGDYPTIISKSVFDKTQERLGNLKATHNYKARPQTEYKHCLSGLFHCGSCGASLAFSGKSKALQCWRYTHARCTVSHSLSAVRAEALVLGELKLITSAVSEGYIKTERLKAEEQEAVMQAGIAELKRRLKRLKEAYLAGAFDIEEYKAERNEIEGKIQGLSNEIRDLENITYSSEAAYDIFINRLNDTEKNSALRAVVEKIVYDKENKTLHFYYLY